MSAKDMRKLVDELASQGWEVCVSGSGHWRLTSPDGAPLTCSMSPSDRHAVKNARADAKKLGAKV